MATRLNKTPANPSQLESELIAAGSPKPLQVYGDGASGAVCIWPTSLTTSQQTAMQTVLTAHVANADYGVSTEIKLLRTYRQNATPTATDTVNALKALIDVVRRSAPAN